MDDKPIPTQEEIRARIKALIDLSIFAPRSSPNVAVTDSRRRRLARRVDRKRGAVMEK